MSANSVEGIMGNTLDKIRAMADVNTIVGSPVVVGETTLIPVSKVTVGFAGGGSDLPSKTGKELMAAGSGAGFSVTPIAFIAITGDSVRTLSLVPGDNSAEKAVGLIPELFDRVTDLIKKTKSKKEKNGDQE